MRATAAAASAGTPIRSFLFVPGDSERKLGKVASSAADAVILDLEDAVSASRKPLARQMVSEFIVGELGDRDGPRLWVRINPLDSGLALEDLAAVVPAAPAGIMIPKIDGPDDVLRVGHYLEALETSHRLPAGAIKVLPVATETARAPFRLGDFATAGIDRLYGLTWGAEDLSAALGASTNVGPDGEWAMTYRLVRSLMLMGARAADVEAVETLYVDIADDEGLAESSRRARAEGFSGRIAIHPGQVDTINAAFTPTAGEVEYAQRVIEAFSADVGTVALDGKMLDLPHLKQAQRVLALAGDH
ncbi:CoA ester lyase [Gordonia pseudamarae]|uniref:HpcH/HpaI aldolase/citrate lyase family protein n=1 Tax=Gordonia TaxID=2053 RepID=UPI00198E39CC|nr:MULTISPECIES: CoA ester lyase [Gordonia]MBD0020803.1 CoA ester lyase [Gordonia sp. (in: high G+C Gram-positive bacteria)]QHN27833.1 CoA ester lyase [Gordonia pseudamarae]